MIEIGGVLGESESTCYYSAIRSLKNQFPSKVLLLLTIPIFFIEASNEEKTKPGQNAVSQLTKYGLKADVLICRFSKPALQPDTLEKIALHCEISKENIFLCNDVKDIYTVPQLLKERGLAIRIFYLLGFAELLKKSEKASTWFKIRDQSLKILEDEEPLKIAFVAKYVKNGDAYRSLEEAFKHAQHKIKRKVKKF